MFGSLRAFVFGVCTALFASVCFSRGATATLTWEPVPEPDIAGYRAFCQVGTNTVPLVFPTPAEATQLPFTNLVEGVAYTFWVTALNTAGLESEPSESVVYIVPGSALIVSWPASPRLNVATYRLFHGELNTAAANLDTGLATSALLTNLVRGKTYFFYAHAYDAGGTLLDEYRTVTSTLPFTGDLPVIVLERVNLAPVVTLLSPANGNRFAAGSSISLSASALDADGQISRVNFYAGTTLIGSATAAPYSPTWSGVPAGRYAISAVAIDNEGLSSRSLTSTIDVIAPPLAPVIATALPATNSVALGWTDVSGEESYQVFLAEGTGASALVATLPANAVSYSCIGLKSGTEYHFRVVAVNFAGSTASAAVTARTIALLLPPPPPASLVAAPSNAVVNLAWQSTATLFNVYRATSASGPFVMIASVEGVSFADHSVTNGLTFYYYVAALNAAGSSVGSAIVSATPHNPPLAPSNLTASAQNGPSVLLKWRDNSSNEQSFVVERSMDGIQFIALTTLAANSTTYTDRAVLPRSRYYYRVRAQNSGGATVSGLANVKTR